MLNSYQNKGTYYSFNYCVYSDTGCRCLCTLQVYENLAKHLEIKSAVAYLGTSFFTDSAKQKIADEKAVKRTEQEMEKIDEQMEASVAI